MNNTTQSPDAARIVVIFVGALGVIFNSATLLVLVTNFTKIFSNVEAILVTNLAVADLLTSFAAMLWGCWPFMDLPRTAAAKALLCAIWMSIASSFLTLSCMAFERLLVVSYPLKAKRIFTKTKTYACCALVWFVSVLTGSMITVNQYIVFFVMTILFELSLAATFVCYVIIYRTVKKLREGSHRRAARYTANNANLSLEVEENESVLHRRVSVRQESRLTNMIFMLVVVLSLTVFPYMVFLQINVIYGLFCPQCAGRAGMLQVMHKVFPLELLNFVVNPLVYTWWLPKFRQVAKKIFRRFFCRSSCKPCRKAKGRAHSAADYSCSSDIDSLDKSPATIFTGHDTGVTAPLNNNRHA